MLLVRPLFRSLGLFLESKTSAEIRLMGPIERLKSCWVEIRNITRQYSIYQRGRFSILLGKKNWESHARKLFYILIRNWVKSNVRDMRQSAVERKVCLIIVSCERIDKRPCDMPFNSRTDIRHINQGPMEIFDETSRENRISSFAFECERRYFTRK